VESSSLLPLGKDFAEKGNPSLILEMPPTYVDVTQCTALRCGYSLVSTVRWLGTPTFDVRESIIFFSLSPREFTK